MSNQKHLPVMQLKITGTAEFVLETNRVSQRDNSFNINWMLRRIME